MTEEEKRALKERLFIVSRQILEGRMTSIREAMDDAQLSANEEGKSSAGDKYETSRAMSHLQKDLFARQLASVQSEMSSLLSVNYLNLYRSVETGAFVECKEFYFFIAAGLGKISFENKTVYFLSPNAPLAKTLHKKTAGTSFHFMKRELIIQEVF